MTPAEFRVKWNKVKLGEIQAYQAHFRDLCALVGHPPPEVADPTGETLCFQRGASKQDGGEGWADVWKKGHFGFEYKGKGRDLDAAYRQLLQYREALENPPLLIVSDLDRILIRTNFTGTRTVLHEIRTDTIDSPASLEALRAVFFDPDKLRPGAVNVTVTQEAAKRIGALAQTLAGRGIPSPAIARFLDRLVFCFFAEDVGILPGRLVSQLLDQARQEPDLFPTTSAELFQKMAAGGRFGLEKIPHVNGSLFDNADTLSLTPGDLSQLHQISQLDWSHIDPSIFGTLFERGLDPAKRAQLGAHYTSREDIETVIEPVVMVPLRREWEAARSVVLNLLTTGRKTDGKVPAKPLAPAAEKKARLEAWEFLDRFLSRLETVKILDPACGSGNFLYVTLRKLKDLEGEVYDFLLDQGFQAPLRVGVGPWQLYGIEINEYAHGLAQLTVWIGYLQWLRQHGTTTWKEPILQAMSNIERKDAILDLTDPANPKEPMWPKADFIVSNPPFLGSRGLRGELGDGYAHSLFETYQHRLGGRPDLVCYWFLLAWEAIKGGRAHRAGLLATQAIRGGTNRKILDTIVAKGGVFFAIGDRDWILDGASVHVSMIGFDRGEEDQKTLDGVAVERIAADLTSGIDLTRAVRLKRNAGVAVQGAIRWGSFDIPDETARRYLEAAGNPNNRPNSDVLLPYINASELAGQNGYRWVVEFPPNTSEDKAAQYEAPFKHVKDVVFPERSEASQAEARERWWLHWRSRPEIRSKLDSAERFLATPRHGKHRLFSWLATPLHPDSALVVFLREDDLFFGLVASRPHSVWSLRKGTQVRERETGFRYTPSSCFETFPFPQAGEEANNAIAAAARELENRRRNWVTPPEWTKEELLEFPASVDGPWKRFVLAPDARGIGTVRWPRVVAKDAEHAKKLAKRTLTLLYNERPAWLVNSHRKLDEAVFAAYGWPVELTDEKILERLLALNLERAKDEKSA